jgi:acetyltransferase-like isoleucine patch superfamily enzyme
MRDDFFATPRWDSTGRPSSTGSLIGPECMLLSHVVIGESTVLEEGVWCDHYTYIGCNSHIGSRAQLMYGARIYHRVTVGARAWIGGFLCNDSIVEPEAVVLGQVVHRFADVTEGVAEAAPRVRRGAFVGMNALVVGNIEVGEGAYVAGGAVLTHSAAPCRLYAGVPARDEGPAPRIFVSRKD